MEPVIRRLIVGAELRPRPPGELTELLHQMSGVAVNINQITPRWPMPAALSAWRIAHIKMMQGLLWQVVKELRMAITKIIAIRDRLDKRVNYAVNGEKTTLDTGITYAANPEKTEQHFFTSAINCESCETAFAEMQATKQRFGKLGGVVGYHFIQSFAPAR